MKNGASMIVDEKYVLYADTTDTEKVLFYAKTRDGEDVDISEVVKVKPKRVEINDEVYRVVSYKVFGLNKTILINNDTYNMYDKSDKNHIITRYWEK